MKTSKGARQAPRTAKAQNEAMQDAAVYRGKRANTRNSLVLRFERALFQNHPEFNGEVEARVIAPGRMLVVACANEKAKSKKEEDPMISSFMSFLAADMQRFPEQIRPLDAELIRGARDLVGDVESSLEEDLGDEPLI